MIIDRTHIRWGVGTCIGTVVVTLIYLANNDPDLLRPWGLAIPLPAWLGPVPPLRGNSGATPLGLIYGTVALLIFIFAALLGLFRFFLTPFFQASAPLLSASWPLPP